MTVDTLIADALSDIVEVDPIKKPLFVKACSAIIRDDSTDLKSMQEMLINMNLTQEVAKFASEFKQFKEPKYALKEEKLLPLSMLKESEENFSKNYTKLPIPKREEAAKALSVVSKKTNTPLKKLPTMVYSQSKGITISPNAATKVAECAYHTSDLKTRKTYLALSKMAAVTTTMDTALKIAHILEDLNRYTKLAVDALGCIFEETTPLLKKAEETSIKVVTKTIPLSVLTQEKVASILGPDIATGLYKEGKLNTLIFGTLPLQDKLLLERYF